MDFKLDIYEGPLALLLNLIQKHEIDIYDIPIAELTDQYIKALKDTDIEELSEFLVMAATLIEIKSKMLLPQRVSDKKNKDPREGLIQALLAYKQVQDIAKQMSTIPLGLRLSGKGEARIIEKQKPVLDPNTDLWKILLDCLQRQAEKIDTTRVGFGKMPKDKFTISEKMVYIMDRLNAGRRTALGRPQLILSDLFESCKSKTEMIVTFLALLELCKRGTIMTKQNNIFGEIDICLN